MCFHSIWKVVAGISSPNHVDGGVENRRKSYKGIDERVPEIGGVGRESRWFGAYKEKFEDL